MALMNQSLKLSHHQVMMSELRAQLTTRLFIDLHVQSAGAQLNKGNNTGRSGHGADGLQSPLGQLQGTVLQNEILQRSDNAGIIQTAKDRKRCDHDRLAEIRQWFSAKTQQLLHLQPGCVVLEKLQASQTHPAGRGLKRFCNCVKGDLVSPGLQRGKEKSLIDGGVVDPAQQKRTSPGVVAETQGPDQLRLSSTLFKKLEKTRNPRFS